MNTKIPAELKKKKILAELDWDKNFGKRICWTPSLYCGLFFIVGELFNDRHRHRNKKENKNIKYY